MQQLTAKRAMRYGAAHYKIGERFEANGRDARVLVAIGHAEPYVQPAAPVRAAQRQKPVEPPPAAPMAEQPPPHEPADEPGELASEDKPRRAYKRRDIRAED